jgi:hypothetical protein
MVTALSRTAFVSVGGMWFHGLNREDRREAVFHKPGDLDAFVDTMIDACARVVVDRLDYCLMLERRGITTEAALDKNFHELSTVAVQPHTSLSASETAIRASDDVRLGPLGRMGAIR